MNNRNPEPLSKKPVGELGESAEQIVNRAAEEALAGLNNLNEKTTLTVRNMDRMAIGQIKMIGDARGWTIAQTLDQMQWAITKFQSIADDQPNSEIHTILDSYDLLFVKR